MTGKDLLFEKYLDYQKQMGNTVTKKDFADYIRVSETYLNLIMNGRRPVTSKMAIRLAKVFNDPRFYQIIENAPLPDAGLEYMQDNWSDLTPEQHKAIQEQTAAYLLENRNKNKQGNHEASPA